MGGEGARTVNIQPGITAEVLSPGMVSKETSECISYGFTVPARLPLEDVFAHQLHRGVPVVVHNG